MFAARNEEEEEEEEGVRARPSAFLLLCLRAKRSHAFKVQRAARGEEGGGVCAERVFAHLKQGAEKAIEFSKSYPSPKRQRAMTWTTSRQLLRRKTS